MKDLLLVPARYRGTSRSGNGGYVAGALAHELGGTAGRAARVLLRQPPPLDATMRVRVVDDGLELTFGGAVVALAAYAEAEVEPVEAVSYDEAAAAGAAYRGWSAHPFPDCFVCGPERDDGLRIFPGEVVATREGCTRVAATWTPDASVPADFHEYDEPTGRACLAATWAALHCVGGWTGDLAGQPMVLGSITAVVDELPVVGEPHVLTGEHRGDEGRHRFTASTLHDSDGRIVARAEHTWVAATYS